MNRHAQDAAARFDNWATTYGDDRLSSWFRFFQAFAISRLDFSSGCGFLDVGCATGWAVREAAKQITCGKACGIDISQKMIDRAIAQAHMLTNADFQVANAEFIPYPEESFTSVLCTCSFHHYPNPLKALCEIKRVMKKDGTLVILESARDLSFAIWLQDLWRKHFERSHVRYYTRQELQALVEQANLRLAKEILTIKRLLFKKKLFTGLMLLECVK